MSISKQEIENLYKKSLSENLSLDMTRGKPSFEQLDLSNQLLEAISPEELTDRETDLRNYGVLDGIPEMKSLFGELLGATTKQVIVGGNSSLAMMHDTVLRALLKGVPGSKVPWAKQSPKFICPVPGYDRHFSICEAYGIEMIPVSLGDDGPDVGEIEKLAAADESVKGIWCVPKYSNPTGCVYSSEVVRGLAGMKTKADDFRIFWDNAYAVHAFAEEPRELENILEAAKKAGNENRPYVFGSTSKISFAGAGVAAIASSCANIEYGRKLLSLQTICGNKINQWRHAKAFPNLSALNLHMQKHAKILFPKFALVEEILKKNLENIEGVSWNSPKGGYFVSIEVGDGKASKVVELAKSAGVKLSAAGSTYPLKKDPKDSNIRIAPSLPSLPELKKAMEIFCICVQLA